MAYNGAIDLVRQYTLEVYIYITIIVLNILCVQVVVTHLNIKLLYEMGHYIQCPKIYRILSALA